jgi:peptidoglycan/xylan/chitin deacetylase (PgdA/CDA1 family)
MGRVAVLAYHAVATSPNPLSVDAACLRDQLSRMLRMGLRPVTFGEAVRGLAPDSCFAVTFDDGFRSVYDRARPVLAELGIRATIFLPTELIDRDEPLCWPGLTSDPMPPAELRPMSWDHVRQLVADGWEVGSHTATHRRLTQVGDDVRRWELEQSKWMCEQQTGVPCRTLAYPFGSANARVVQAARDAGYVGAVTMGRLRRIGPLAVPRIGVYSHDSHRRFALKVSRPVRSVAGSIVLSVYHGIR